MLGRDQAPVGCDKQRALLHVRAHAGGVQAAAGEAGEGGRPEAAAALREDTLHVRKGVAPGSFLDLLMRAKDRTTGAGFTDLELANQVRFNAVRDQEKSGASPWASPCFQIIPTLACAREAMMHTHRHGPLPHSSTSRLLQYTC